MEFANLFALFFFWPHTSTTSPAGSTMASWTVAIVSLQGLRWRWVMSKSLRVEEAEKLHHWKMQSQAFASDAWHGHAHASLADFTSLDHIVETLFTI